MNDKTIASLRRGMTDWQRRTIRHRLKLVRELRYLVVERRKELCDSIAKDVERTAGEVTSNELLPTAVALQFLEKQAESILQPRTARGTPGWLMGVQAKIVHHPLGVVGVLGTWNYPLFLNACLLYTSPSPRDS